jgi:hypothetical protein
MMQTVFSYGCFEIESVKGQSEFSNDVILMSIMLSFFQITFFVVAGVMHGIVTIHWLDDREIEVRFE